MYINIVSVQRYVPEVDTSKQITRICRDFVCYLFLNLAESPSDPSLSRPEIVQEKKLALYSQYMLKSFLSFRVVTKI